MERYVVTLLSTSSSDSEQLLVPIHQDQPVSALLEEVQRRYAKRSALPLHPTLRLNSVNGPILDEEDALKHVIPDPRTDVIVAIHDAVVPPPGDQQYERQNKKTTPPTDLSLLPGSITPATAANGVKIRIITPALANTHPDINTIPLLQGGVYVPSDITLWNLKNRIANSLGHDLSEGLRPKKLQLCNCAFTKYLLKRGCLIQPDSFILIHGDNKVVRLALSRPTRECIFQVLHQKFDTEVESKYTVQLKDGIQDAEGTCYIMVPIVSVCSLERHASDVGRPRPRSTFDSTSQQAGRAAVGSEKDAYDLDIHSSEAPIEVADTHVSLAKAGLLDCQINGVLNLYIVEREGSSKLAEKKLGKNAIFRASSFWEQAPRQSRRGMAAFLSSLRVFTHLINAAVMEEQDQDGVLGQIISLTNFPPAMLAMYILMQGNTPRPSQCAALIQTLLLVLKKIVPLNLIRGEESRFLEGSRLLFGFILAKAKQRTSAKKSRLAYIESVKTFDLLNPGTLQPIQHPISTSMGMLEETFFEALQTPDLFEWSDGETAPQKETTNSQAHRLALITGGKLAEVCALDIDRLNAHLQSDRAYPSASKSESFWDMNNLATLCEENGLVALLPSALQRAEPPVLSLDKDCSLSVYLGKVPCADPSKDNILFRPTYGEEHVDAALLTQIIAPVIEARSKDGTFIFESAGGSKRQAREPDEIIIFTVDCSQSMCNPSDFLEMQETDHETSDSEMMETNDGGDIVAQPTDAGLQEDTSLSFIQVKEIVFQHEAFSDMLAILHAAGPLRTRSFATRITKHLTILYSRERDHFKKQIQNLKQWATFRHLQRNNDQIQYGKLKRIVAGFVKYEEGIIDNLVFCANSSPTDRSEWKWTVNDPIPEVLEHKSLTGGSAALALAIPLELVCPISQELFEDPVTAIDGFTYDRKAIQRWFQIRKTSPSTGLPLVDIALRSNGFLANSVRNWVQGESVGESAPPESKKRRPSSTKDTHIEVEFVGLGNFFRTVSKDLSVADLYRFAFQGMRGKFDKFELRHNHKALTPSEQSIEEQGLAIMPRIVISPLVREISSVIVEEGGETPKPNTEEHALIKVYKEQKHLFSYWVPRRNNLTFTALIFRYWRYLADRRQNFHKDVDIWTELKYSGDGGCTGVLNNHWAAMMPFAKPAHGTGILGEERLYWKPGETGTKTQLDIAHLHVLVLKMQVDDHAYQAVIERRKAREARTMSRLDTSKYIFDNLVNRTLAYNLATHIGLISFSSTPKVAQHITHAIEDFRTSMSKMVSGGDTCVWDALALANHHITEYAQRFPSALKRIVCLSDGLDTSSSKLKHDVCQGLINNNVVVDSFCIGDENNIDLRTVSWLTGGYKFVPKSLDDAMAISEMEPVLNQSDRASTKPQSQTRPLTMLSFKQATAGATPDVVTRDVYPQRKQNPKLEDSFVTVSDMSRIGAPSTISVAAKTLTQPSLRSNANVRPARLLSELRHISQNPHPHYEVFVSESDIGFWKILLQGPPGTSYDGGTFLLYLQMEDRYPAFPPTGRFCTPILHPNINRHGRICHSILDRNWTADTSNLSILNTIYSLLLTPEFSDPINSIVIQNYHWDQVAFQDEVREHIKKHASESREAMRDKILGE